MGVARVHHKARTMFVYIGVLFTEDLVIESVGKRQAIHGE